MGAVVTLLVPLECAPSPLVINTPYLPSEDPNDSGGATLPQALRTAILRVIAEAQRYLRGDRAQGDLFRVHAAERPAHDQDGVVEELEPAAAAHDVQSAAEPESLSDGPIRDRHDPHEVRAEFRTEAMQAACRQARPRSPRSEGRRLMGGLSPMRILLGFLFLFLIASPSSDFIVLVLLVLLVCWLVGELILSSLFWSAGQIMTTRSNPA